jgi:hypothetical protein
MIYEVEAEITLKKRYFVEAANKAQAIHLLAESGIVNSDPEDEREEEYDTDYTIIRSLTKAQLEEQGAELDID